MPDRDAEIAAMVDEFLADSAPRRQGTPMGGYRTAKQRAHDIQWMRNHRNVTVVELPPMPEDMMLVTDQTPLDDVIHSGVIGTES